MSGREEALERARLAARQRNLNDLQSQFTGSWFPGGAALDEPIIRLHDAAHQWSNISPTQRGELQQNILDIAGTKELYDRTGARGFVNSYPFGIGGIRAKDFDDDAVVQMLELLQETSQGIEDPVKGIATQRELPVNDPARLQYPPIEMAELKELVRRGREFYGHVGQSFQDQALKTLKNADPDRTAWEYAFRADPAMSPVRLKANAQSGWVHDSPDKVVLSGGYDAPGQMPYGPIEARLNRPLQYTVDEGLLMKQADRAFRRDLQSWQDKYAKRGGSVDLVDRAMLARNYGLPDYNDFPGSPEDTAMESQIHDRAIARRIREGMGHEVSAVQYAPPGLSSRALADVAAEARQLGRVRDAVRAGFNATADLAGAVPLFDPRFRAAVERGDIQTAAKQVAQEYAAGAAAAPVVGTGMGVLQRVAPRAAAAAIPVAAAVSNVVSPVAVVSQLGGSSRQSAAQRVADQRAAQSQLQRAEAARKRGGRWKVGPLTLPEWGISEAGGLLFR